MDYSMMDPPTEFVPPGLTDGAFRLPTLGTRYELTLDLVPREGGLLAVYVFGPAWDGASDDGRVFLATASGPEGERVVQLGGSTSTVLPRYESLTLVRDGDVWSVRADGQDLMRHDGSGRLEHVTSMGPGATTSIVVSGLTVIQATYREIS